MFTLNFIFISIMYEFIQLLQHSGPVEALRLFNLLDCVANWQQSQFVDSALDEASSRPNFGHKHSTVLAECCCYHASCELGIPFMSDFGGSTL